MTNLTPFSIVNRVWSVETSRMIHILVGHANKITCCRLFGGERGVISASADRSLKVWDISRQTYRQTATLRHSSTANAVDVGIDSLIAVSGHLDGGLRFWEVQTGERTAEIEGESSVTIFVFQADNLEAPECINLSNSLFNKPSFLVVFQVYTMELLLSSNFILSIRQKS
jgi:WD40 repeat protein